VENSDNDMHVTIHAICRRGGSGKLSWRGEEAPAGMNDGMMTNSICIHLKENSRAYSAPFNAALARRSRQ